MKLRFKCLGCGKIATLGIGATWVCRCNREWYTNSRQELRLKSMFRPSIPVEGIDFEDYEKEE